MLFSLIYSPCDVHPVPHPAPAQPRCRRHPAPQPNQSAPAHQAPLFFHLPDRRPNQPYSPRRSPPRSLSRLSIASRKPPSAAKPICSLLSPTCATAIPPPSATPAKILGSPTTAIFSSSQTRTRKSSPSTPPLLPSPPPPPRTWFRAPSLAAKVTVGGSAAQASIRLFFNRSTTTPRARISLVLSSSAG